MLKNTINLTKLSRLANRCETYEEFRENFWNRQDLTGVNFAAGTRNEKPLKADFLFKPKPILFYKDTWYAATPLYSKKLAIILLSFPDILALEVDRLWLKGVNYTSTRDHILKGQVEDERIKLRGS
jgi:hypothetical protein